MEGQPIPHFSRRALLETVMASCTLPVFAQTAADAQATGPGPRSFHVGIPQAAIDRILTRVRETRCPDRLETPDWSYGANWDYMKALAEYWTTRFDWRKAEANLNRHPQFLARVGDFDIHFYHVKGRGPKPVPLIWMAELRKRSVWQCPHSHLFGWHRVMRGRDEDSCHRCFRFLSCELTLFLP
jgi:hypothetical protein